MQHIKKLFILFLFLFLLVQLDAQNRRSSKTTSTNTNSDDKKVEKTTEKSSSSTSKTTQKTESKEDVKSSSSKKSSTKETNPEEEKTDKSKKSTSKSTVSEKTGTISKAKSTVNELKQELIKYKNLSYGKLLKFAGDLEDEGSYVNAVVYYKLAHDKKPFNKCVLQKLSLLNFKLRDFHTSQEYTTKLLELDSKYDKDANLRLALCMKANKEYKDAIQELDFIAASKKTNVSQKVIENEKQGATLGLELRNKVEPKVKVENVSQLNGYLQEYAPQALKNDNILYSAFLDDTAINLTKNKREGRDYTSKLLFSHFDKDNNVYEKPALLPQEINIPEVHIGNGVMDESGKIIYFTQCNEAKKLEMRCKIYLSEKKDGKWFTEELKTLNAKGNTNTHPSLYDDGSSTKYLLFSSDRNGGRGGMDIYYTKLNDKGRPTGDPQNLAGINTFADDITPFYQKKDKTLYFSSTGYPSIGGFDVFKVTGTIGKWDKVINMKHPVNSSLDDIYLKLDENNEGYFVTNREGSKSPRGATCCDDLWSVRKYDYNVWIKGIYASSADEFRKPLNGVDAVMIDKDGKLMMKKVTANDSAFIVKLTKGGSYRINGLKDGYYPGIDSFSAPKELYKDDTIYRVFLLDPIEKKRYVVENVYYAFDKSVVREEYHTIMDSVLTLMAMFPNMFLKIDGHTDSRGTEFYNQGLSERRCKAAAEYLLLKGLAPERIIMRGYSEIVPLAPNTTPSGEDDPAGRAKNRRVEFKLLAPNGKDPKLDIEYRVNTPFSNE